MAQHYPVDINKEVELKRSLQRLGKYLVRPYILTSFKRESTQRIYHKRVQILSSQYKTDQRDFVVFAIGTYDLKRTKKQWDNNWKNATLEVHYDRVGNIVNVYYPL